MSIQTHARTPALQLTDSASCARWIAALPITNVQQAQQLLAEQIAALTVSQLPTLERLKILEALKETVLFAQAELAKRYIGKPLPLDQADAKAWVCVMGLWRAYGAAYRVCLDAYRAGDVALAPHAALLTLRCLRTASLALFEHYYVYREPDAASWRGFHELFACAEEHGLSRLRVQDTFAGRDADASCTEAYVQGLMANLANPYALSVRQMAFLWRWLEKWCSLVELSRQPLPPSSIPPLAVDFAKDEAPGLAAHVAVAPSARYLDLEPLSKTLRQTINLLKQGQTPGQLGLGDDARQPACENLIMLLYLQWCRAGTLRTEVQRAAAADPAEVCFGIPDAFKLVGGDDRTRQEIEINAVDKWELDHLGFSMRLSSTAKQAAVKKTEAWQILNHSNSGFMCMLRDPSGVMRLSHNQLLGIRRGAVYRLGIVQWLKVDSRNETLCGVRLFPGVPQTIKARPANFNIANRQDQESALLLPEIKLPAAPLSLILPAGWFQYGRIIEIQTDAKADPKRVAKLTSVIDRGADFDRCMVIIT